jgi:hypothetical protein
MWYSVFLLALGAATTFYVGWYIPRAMRRVRQRIVESGGDTTTLDERMASRKYRTWMMAGVSTGVLLMAVGTIAATLGD